MHPFVAICKNNQRYEVFTPTGECFTTTKLPDVVKVGHGSHPELSKYIDITCLAESMRIPNLSLDHLKKSFNVESDSNAEACLKIYVAMLKKPIETKSTIHPTVLELYCKNMNSNTIDKKVKDKYSHIKNNVTKSRTRN